MSTPATERRAALQPKPFTRTSMFWLCAIAFAVGPPSLWILWDVLSRMPLPAEDQIKYMLQGVLYWFGLMATVFAPTALGRSLVSVAKVLGPTLAPFLAALVAANNSKAADKIKDSANDG